MKLILGLDNKVYDKYGLTDEDLKQPLLIDKRLLAKCKLLGDYRLFQKTYNIGVSEYTNEYWFSTDCATIVTDRSFLLKEIVFYNIDNTSSSGGKFIPEDFKTIESHTSTGMTRVFNILDHKIYVSNFHKTVLVLKEDTLMTGISFNDYVTKVQEENGMLNIKTHFTSVLVDLETYERFVI